LDASNPCDPETYGKMLLFDRSVKPALTSFILL
jgi:hypothetical protein